jgi:hypothetical protein
LRIGTKPNVVVILATDIRDRLFLLSEVRGALPAALPVMMELDYLAIHPDYRATSRGAIVVPSGDSIVCLRFEGIEPSEGDESANATGGDRGRAQPTEDDGAIVVPCEWRPPKRMRAFSFATDYAANTFRAHVLLLQRRDQPRAKFSNFRKDAQDQIGKAMASTPCLYLATLAGFNELTFPENSEYCARGGQDRARSSMVAADTRMVAQMPAYLTLTLLSSFFLVVASWVNRRPCEGRILLSAVRYVLLDGRWMQQASRRTWRRLRALPGVKPGKRTLRNLFGWTPRVRAKRLGYACQRLSPKRVRFAMLWLIGFATLAFLLSIVGWSQAARNFSLAHGRDPIALMCLWLLYFCFCALAFARMKLADHRIARYISHFAPAHLRHPSTDKPPTWSWAIPMIATCLTLAAVFAPMGRPTSVDSTIYWWLGLFVLALGVAFLVNFGRLLRLIGRVTLFVSGALPNIRERPGLKDWPKPQVVLVSPQTPFNLTLLRHRDVRALCHEDPERWGEATCSLVDGTTGDKHWMAPVVFLKWQEQLVAELKTYVVAMRSCAWCAILAPITVLIGLSVYSPIFERRFTTLAVLLLIASFSYIVYAVLRLEQDPILGPMFTRDGDKLTFGGGLRALWPKFVAMGVVLLPLVLPSIWGWLHGLIRSVNSFT